MMSNSARATCCLLPVALAGALVSPAQAGMLAMRCVTQHVSCAPGGDCELAKKLVPDLTLKMETDESTGEPIVSGAEADRWNVTSGEIKYLLFPNDGVWLTVDRYTSEFQVDGTEVKAVQALWTGNCERIADKQF